VSIINGSSQDVFTYFTSRFGHAVSTMMLH
jgi:hypothetical protein